MVGNIKFQRGKDYRTREGKKRLCVYVWLCGDALLVDESDETPTGYLSHPNGRLTRSGEHPGDIVGEWG